MKWGSKTTTQNPKTVQESRRH